MSIKCEDWGRLDGPIYDIKIVEKMGHFRTPGTLKYDVPQGRNTNNLLPMPII